MMFVYKPTKIIVIFNINIIKKYKFKLTHLNSVQQLYLNNRDL